MTGYRYKPPTGSLEGWGLCQTRVRCGDRPWGHPESRHRPTARELLPEEAAPSAPGGGSPPPSSDQLHGSSSPRTATVSPGTQSWAGSPEAPRDPEGGRADPGNGHKSAPCKCRSTAGKGVSSPFLGGGVLMGMPRSHTVWDMHRGCRGCTEMRALGWQTWPWLSSPAQLMSRHSVGDKANHPVLQARLPQFTN